MLKKNKQHDSQQSRPHDPNKFDITGKTALARAAEIDNISFIKDLIRDGADVNLSRPPSHMTPLHVAAKSGSGSTVRYLLENGANIMLRDMSNQTPLECALITNRIDTALILIEAGAIASQRFLDNLDMYTEEVKASLIAQATDRNVTTSVMNNVDSSKTHENVENDCEIHFHYKNEIKRLITDNNISLAPMRWKHSRDRSVLEFKIDILKLELNMKDKQITMQNQEITRLRTLYRTDIDAINARHAALVADLCLGISDDGRLPECCVCMSRPVSGVFKDCWHACICRECSRKCDVCPVCRRKEVVYQPLYF
jgi:hypothetical protein